MNIAPQQQLLQQLPRDLLLAEDPCVSAAIVRVS
jgi:hypothetical protein